MKEKSEDKINGWRNGEKRERENDQKRKNEKKKTKWENKGMRNWEINEKMSKY